MLRNRTRLGAMCFQQLTRAFLLVPGSEDLPSELQGGPAPLGPPQPSSRDLRRHLVERPLAGSLFPQLHALSGTLTSSTHRKLVLVRPKRATLEVHRRQQTRRRYPCRVFVQETWPNQAKVGRVPRRVRAGPQEFHSS